MQQLEFKQETKKDLEAPGYNDRVQAEYDRQAEARGEKVKKKTLAKKKHVARPDFSF